MEKKNIRKEKIVLDREKCTSLKIFSSAYDELSIRKNSLGARDLLRGVALIFLCTHGILYKVVLLMD